MKRIIVSMTVLTAFLAPSIASAGPIPPQSAPVPGQFVSPGATGLAVPLSNAPASLSNDRRGNHAARERGTKKARIASATGPVPPVPAPRPGQFVSPGATGLAVPLSNAPASVTRSGDVVPLTDGGSSDWWIGTTGWIGEASAPTWATCASQGDECVGTGYDYANNGNSAWNEIAVCGEQLVTGGWQLIDCAYEPGYNNTEYSNFNSASESYAATVCGRWYTTYTWSEILVTGGWQTKAGQAPGLQACS
jgi:hypothetical protein